MGVALAVCPGQMRQSLPGTRCLRQYSYGSQSPEQCTLGERRSPRSVHVPADVPDIFLMVTRAGARRRSLRRPIADATSMTPKAARNCDALGDHQRSRKCGVDSRGAPGLAGRAWTRGARLDSRCAPGLAGRAWTRGARLDSRGALGLAGRAWTRGARLDSRGAPGLAGRAWTREARLDSRGAGRLRCVACRTRITAGARTPGGYR